jgi:hypothetical protein
MNPDVVRGLSEFEEGRIQAAKDEQREKQKRAFFNAIVAGNRGPFDAHVDTFKNDSVPVYTLYIHDNVQVNPAGDTQNRRGECYRNELNLYTRGVGSVLHRLILRKGFLPATCEEVPFYSLTPLMLAKLLGREDMVETLLQKGASQKATALITYYRKGRFLGGPKEELEHPWTYKDFSQNPDDWRYKEFVRIPTKQTYRALPRTPKQMFKAGRRHRRTRRVRRTLRRK